VPAAVVEHVAHRAPGLQRSANRLAMEAIGEYRAPPALHHAVQASGHADAQSLHAARQRPGAAGLDEQMHVISLHGILDHPKLRRHRTLVKARPNTSESLSGAQAVNVAPHAHGDVHWNAPAHRWPAQVRDAGAAAVGLATGPGSRPAVACARAST